LEESFEGWYLNHSKKTLTKIEVVKEAVFGERPAGLVMLKTLYDTIGYVYYIAVAKDYRRRKVATYLLEHSLACFSGLGISEVYASIEEGNTASEGLFRSCGFMKTRYKEVSGKYGNLRALSLYRKMLVVPGETLLCRSLGSTLLSCT
jgi:ribosomal protein S18 acetylase RimI-like enzyme